MVGLSPEAFGRPYISLLDDRSIAAYERTRTMRLDFLAQLERIDRASLSRDRCAAPDKKAKYRNTDRRDGGQHFNTDRQRQRCHQAAERGLDGASLDLRRHQDQCEHQNDLRVVVIDRAWPEVDQRRKRQHGQ